MSLWSKNLISAFSRLHRQETVVRQLHALVKAGVPLPTAFVQLRKYAPDERWAEGISTVAKAVASGRTLGEALAGQPALFDGDQVELLSAAEASGSLERVLAALAGHLEQVRALRWKALVSSIWPLYLVGIAVFLSPFVRVASSGVRSLNDVAGAYVAGLLPGLTAALLVVGGLVFLPVAVAAAGAERAFDQWLLRLPGLGGALRSLAASRALLTLGLSLSAGLEVARAVRAAVLSTARPSLLPRADDAVAALRAGGTLTEALEGLGLFDRATLGQLGVAEHTGTLDEALARLAPEVHERSLRAVRVLVFVAAGVIAALALAVLVSSLLGAIFGPIKAYYDLAGSQAP